ncbi:MAG: M20/M25/M40 family metallo-hydrolase [Solirubrobacteraceae bacterium]|nr:M20/M25/M40 family metallo-hydrolase [Solirubrobacteraceae bacterium]
MSDLSSPELAAKVHALMPQLQRDLEDLVRIPSISGDGMPAEPIQAGHDAVAELLRGAGVEKVWTLELPDTNPIVMGEIPAPPGAPTVLLYSHYDVVPAGDLEEWDTDPFEPVTKNGAIYGRGSADTKSNIMAHVGALRAWDGKPPVGIKIVIEGQEEVGGGALTPYPPTNPELFWADVMIIGDMGSVSPGIPTLTVALRGMCEVTFEVRTLASAKHSGQYGGAAPDALVALVQALATLHDEHGNVAVEGLRREEWTGGGSSEDEFYALAEVQGDLPLIGTGNLGSRVWSGPAITIVGIDVPSVDGAVNAVSPYARAKLNIRVHPEQDAAEAQAAVIAHLQQTKPFGIGFTVSGGATGNGFAARTESLAYDAARESWQATWEADVVKVGVGGSIPLVNALQQAAPEADMLLVGATDGYANIHGPNERVLLDEFEKATLAEADFLGRFAAAYARAQA